MADIADHIMSRRSIRQYTEEPVSREEVQNLLRAGMSAPSASNRKPWEFVVVTDDAVLSGLRKSLIFGRYHAPAAIVVCGSMKRAWPGPGRGFWIQDCSASMENILLAAAGRGLGAVWVGVYPIGPFVKAVSAILSLPKHVVPLGVAYVGHPAEDRAPRTQYSEDRVHWDRYGSREPRSGRSGD